MYDLLEKLAQALADLDGLMQDGVLTSKEEIERLDGYADRLSLMTYTARRFNANAKS